MAECKIIFQDTPYTEEQFKNALKKGLLYNLIDRKIIDLPINIGDLGVSTKGFEQHFVSNKEDIKKSMMDVFQLPEKEASAVSEIYDRVAFAWASRHNSTREKFYNTITLFKGDPVTIQKMKDVYNQEEPLVREALRTGYIKGENTQKVARERFDIPNLKLISKQGSDRDVYDLGNGKVLKVAKTARGLRQNMYEGADDLQESNLLPEVSERGLNYVVAEKLQPLDDVKHRYFFRTLTNIGAETVELQDLISRNKNGSNDEKILAITDRFENELIKVGFGMYTQYELLWGDVAKDDSWGVDKDGHIMLVDAGTLAGSNLISDYEGKTDLDDKDFMEIFNRSDKARDKYEDKDWDNLFYQGVQSLANNININGTDISNVLDVLNTPKNFIDTLNKKGDFKDIRKDLLNQIKQNIDLVKEFIKESKSKIITKDSDVSEVQQRILDKRENKLNILQRAHDIISDDLLSFNDIKVNDKLLNQNAQAAVQISKDGRAIIYALSNPNISSPIHELAHVWESQLRPNETQDILDWAGHDEWTNETSEKFARGFEKYLADGLAPTPIIKGLFEQFKEWLTNIYKGIVGSDIDLELNEPMKKLYSKMLGENYKTEAELAIEAEKSQAPKEGERDMRPDTMERRKAEYVEPTVVDKKAKEQHQLDLLNLPDKHLHPIDPEAIDYYGWASQIQNAIRTGLYVDSIQNGDLDEEQVREILRSMHWIEGDKEASDRMADKNLANIMFKVNDTGSTYSIQGLIETPIDHPSFQSLVNYFVKTGKFQTELDNGNITYQQAKIILDATISHDVETREKLEKLVKQVDDKVGKEKKTQKIVKEKIAKEEVKKEEVVEKAQQEELVPTPEETVLDVVPELPDNSNEPLKAETNIEVVDNFDNSSSFYIRDNNGNVIMNDSETSIDGSYDTYQEAEAALNEHNRKTELKALDINDENYTDNVDKINSKYRAIRDEQGSVLNKNKNVSKPEEQKSTIKESPVDYANRISKMSESEREDLDFFENIDGMSLYEGRKQMPTENSTKFKKVEDDVVLGYQYEYLANIDGIPYGLTKQEDPDDPDNDKAFVWSYTRLDNPSDTHDTYISNNAELIKEIQANKRTKDSEEKSTGTKTTQQPIVKESTPQSVTVENTSGYKVGDRVSAKGKNGIITEIDEDGYARLEDEDGGFVAFSNVNKLQAPVAEEVKQEAAPVSKDDRVPVKDITPEMRAENRDKKDMLERVAERMQKFMPSVTFDIDYFTGTWKGRIKNGVVQINLRNATLDTPIHEFMHPFVLALRLSNYELYSNLTEELRYGALSYYIDLVKGDKNYSNLTEQEQEEEALVRYLAEDIQTVFTERGHIDQTAMDERKNSFLERVYQWFKDLLDKLWGVNNKPAGAKNGTIDKMQRLTINKKTGVVKAYKAGAKEGTISFRLTNINNKEERGVRNISDATAQEISDIANASEQPLVEIYVEDLHTVAQSKPEDKRGQDVLMSVADFPVNITLKDLSDFIIGQEKIGIDLSAEQTAIDKLEAYQNDTEKEANEILKGIEKRLKGFADEGGRRIMNVQQLPTQINEIKRILREYDGVQGVEEYLRQGMEGLNLAYRMVRYIQEDLDADRAARVGSGGFAQGKLTQDDINGLNRDLAEVRSLLGFYNDISDLYKVYGDSFDRDEKKNFEKLFARAELRKKSIAGIATDLQAKWLFPYLEEAQRNLPQEKRLTFEKFKRNLRFVDQDASSVSYWMGASINSRDPLTAILAVAVKDKLNHHHNEEIDKLNEIKTVFDRWLKRTGTPNRIGAIEDYYKKNFLRKAKVWETTYMDALPNAKVGDRVNFNDIDGTITEIENGKAKVTGYASRWAFHEEYYMDLYHDDLRKFTESLTPPITTDDWNVYNNRLKAWVNANEPTYTKSAKYRNPEFARVSNDEYFQTLYNTYKESNVKYGERQLQYGIVPQAYRADTLLDKGKNLVKGAGDLAKSLGSKDSYTLDKAAQSGIDAFNYVFDEDEYMKAKDMNLDGSYYRGVKSPFTHLIHQDKLDLRLNESVYGFHSSANSFSALREVQANVENLRLLIEGNPYLRIEARKIASSDKTGRTVFDRFLGKPQSKDKGSERANEQLLQFINDTFYGEDTFQANFKVGKLNVNLNKLGTNLGFVTALSNMAGNVFAGISNVTVGNIMSLGEAVGGKYYGVKDWGKGLGMYMKSTPEFLADSVRPVKSKITQLGILYDAIQGEFRDKYGKNITGNITQRYASGDTFFIINHVAEHQIQLTGMLALMNATKVKIKGGGEVSLFDAYQANAKGFYKIRPDAEWTNEHENEFTRRLHGISKDLNGNYAAFDKGVLQRYWWGKLAIQYRKYMYPAWRSRFAGERIDYERGEVIEGYYRTFHKKLWEDIKTYKFNIIKLIGSQAKGFMGKNASWTKEQQYAHRKTMFDLGIVVATSLIAASLAGMEAGSDGDKDKWAKNALMLQMLRLRFDMSQFNISIIPEVMQQIKNPSASLNTLADWGQFLQQLTAPTDTYSQNSGYHEQGDSKLGAKFSKVIPLYRQYLRLMKPEEAVKYFNLINANVKKEDEEKDTK